MGFENLMGHRDEIKDSNLVFTDIIFPCPGAITCCPFQWSSLWNRKHSRNFISRNHWCHQEIGFYTRRFSMMTS